MKLLGRHERLRKPIVACNIEVFEAQRCERKVTVHVLVDAVWCQGGALAGSQGVPAASWSSAWRALIPFLRVVER